MKIVLSPYGYSALAAELLLAAFDAWVNDPYATPPRAYERARVALGTRRGGIVDLRARDALSHVDRHQALWAWRFAEAAAVLMARELS
jgi:hypothetical protein